MNDLIVANVMTPEVLALAMDTSLSTAARLLVTRHISGAPVVDSTGRPRGVVTLRDLADPDRASTDTSGTALYYRLEQGDPQVEGDGVVGEGGVVSDVMSPYVLAVGTNTPLVEAIRTMVSEQVHRLLVSDQGKLVGILTSMDVLRALLRPRVASADVGHTCSRRAQRCCGGE